MGPVAWILAETVIQLVGSTRERFETGLRSLDEEKGSLLDPWIEK